MNKILLRQLKRLGLNENTPPENSEGWRDFLKNIDHYYEDADADRYRLERSMDISSNEMQELNSKLQSAQDMAGLGYWTRDLVTNETTWSLKLFEIFGLDLAKKIPSLDEVMARVHPDDREKIRKALEEAMTNGISYNLQYRMIPFNQTTEYKWFQAICEPGIAINGKHTKLSGIAMDIDERKKTELEIERLNSQLFDTARRAGMSEVATSMLHNIGNVLNSAHTTAEWIENELNNVIYERVGTLSQLIEQHKDHLAAFLTEDEAGKKIPEYLSALNERIKKSNLTLKDEIKSLLSHLKHISEITSSHKLTSGVSGINSKIKISSVIDEAIAICMIDINNNQINLTKQIKYDATFVSDKHKIIQILINLIKNAIESLASCPTLSDKKISICVENAITDDNSELLISVSDNGAGISKETLKELFKFGFTTKKNGHGFGLHGSAIAANELHAKLNVESDGFMQGAKFTLAIPLPITEGAT